MELEKIKNLVSMLQSVDKENHTVALHVIDTWTKEDIIPLMLCYLQGGEVNIDIWENNAPNALKMLTQKGYINHKYSGISWETVFITMIRDKAPTEYIQYLLDIQANILELLSSKHPDIQNIMITINNKNNE